MIQFTLDISFGQPSVTETWEGWWEETASIKDGKPLLIRWSRAGSGGSMINSAPRYRVEVTRPATLQGLERYSAILDALDARATELDAELNRFTNHNAAEEVYH
jgi:hypothetical protein